MTQDPKIISVVNEQEIAYKRKSLTYTERYDLLRKLIRMHQSMQSDHRAPAK